jgi:hypothetical protein
VGSTGGGRWGPLRAAGSQHPARLDCGAYTAAASSSPDGRPVPESLWRAPRALPDGNKRCVAGVRSHVMRAKVGVEGGIRTARNRSLQQLTALLKLSKLQNHSKPSELERSRNVDHWQRPCHLAVTPGRRFVLAIGIRDAGRLPPARGPLPSKSTERGQPHWQGARSLRVDGRRRARGRATGGGS